MSLIVKAFSITLQKMYINAIGLKLLRSSEKPFLCGGFISEMFHVSGKLPDINE